MCDIKPNGRRGLSQIHSFELTKKNDKLDLLGKNS